MARLRSNEWNFAANAAARISEILNEPRFGDSPLGHAEPELTEFMGNRRLDLAIFARTNPAKPLITAELKVPWDALGRTPHNTKVVADAHSKASNCGARFFITWNIRRAVVWRTDDPGVPLPQRVIYDKELIPVLLTNANDLSKAEFQTTWRRAVEELVEFLHQTLTGPPQPAYLPLDRQFIARLESLLDFPIAFTADGLRKRIQADTRFRRTAEAWMRDRQRWVVSQATMSENLSRASRFSCYVLVNRLCFYNALRRKYPQLPRISVHNRITTAEALQRKLSAAFTDATRYTGDYDTVFEPDVGDQFPFLSDQAVAEWRNLIQSLDSYDFATIDLEVIGAMYERLISPEERHRYGQHYTQPAIVDLINAFSITAGNAAVLDPACGGGTFLVRAYAKKKALDSNLDHTELLSTLYGCDVLHYACHLTIINLAIRDLIDDDNYPRIHVGDFLDVTSDSVFADIPIRIAAGGLSTGRRQLTLAAAGCDAVVGNPPYIQAKEIPADRRAAYADLTRREWPNYNWSNASDILVWFFTHSAQFLRPDGYLSLLTQSAWLDVEYGFALQHWMLENFQIVAILETEAEPWFTDARVATAVTILRRNADPDECDDNLVRFVQFRAPLPRAQSNDSDASRLQAAEEIRDAVLSYTADAMEERFRIRVVSQAELRGVGTDDDGNYVGSKWGRYLRSLDAIYELHQTHATSFCILDDLATVERGVTTNCDDFFIVTDVTDEALQRCVTTSAFSTSYGIRRNDALAGRYKIIRRDDGVELPLETELLVPTLKSAREINVRRTSAIPPGTYAVAIPAIPRGDLSRTAEAYVAAGERERWHETASFRGRDDWYVLRYTGSAPILFVKTIQYTPQVLWNDATLLANQRLYDIVPRSGVDGEVLGALLNSTIFAAERFAGVKALGREAANDVEVFTARQFKVPDIRRFSASVRQRLADAFSDLRQRDAGPLVEATLLDAGRHEARVYADRNPVDERVWPAELHDEGRRRIDTLIFRGIGVSAAEADAARCRLYNELTAFLRKARLLELDARVNRRGMSNGNASPGQLADDLWADLIQRNEATVRTIPDGFIAENARTTVVQLPAGSVSIAERELFSDGNDYALAFGRSTRVSFASSKQRDLALLIAQNGIRGSIALPKTATACETTATAIRAYLDDLRPRLNAAAADITENPDLQRRIVREAFRRLSPHQR